MACVFAMLIDMLIAQQQKGSTSVSIPDNWSEIESLMWERRKLSAKGFRSQTRWPLRMQVIAAKEWRGGV